MCGVVHIREHNIILGYVRLALNKYIQIYKY